MLYSVCCKHHNNTDFINSKQVVVFTKYFIQQLCDSLPCLGLLWAQGLVFAGNEWLKWSQIAQKWADFCKNFKDSAASLKKKKRKRKRKRKRQKTVSPRIFLYSFLVYCVVFISSVGKILEYESIDCIDLIRVQVQSGAECAIIAYACANCASQSCAKLLQAAMI